MKRPIFLTVFEREMAGAFRDRNLTAHFILIPLLMYPLILWLGMTVALLVEAGSSGSCCASAHLPASILLSKRPSFPRTTPRFSLKRPASIHRRT